MPHQSKITTPYSKSVSVSVGNTAFVTLKFFIAFCFFPLSSREPVSDYWITCSHYYRGYTVSEVVSEQRKR